MRSVMKKDREMRDLDREIGFAPERAPRKSLGEQVHNVLGFLVLGFILFILTIATIHILFYLF